MFCLTLVPSQDMLVHRLNNSICLLLLIYSRGGIHGGGLFTLFPYHIDQRRDKLGQRKILMLVIDCGAKTTTYIYSAVIHC